MDLSIIIVNWNTRDLLAQCLTSIYAYPPDCDFEVWVVDNASTDGSLAMLQECFPIVQLIENRENVGFARANNQAIQQSIGKYVLLLNSDAQVLPTTLQNMIEFMGQHFQAGAMGAKLVNPDKSFQASYAVFPTLTSELLLATGLAQFVYGPFAPSPRPYPGEEAKTVDWVAGAALLIRRSTMDDIGLLDESYFFYSEETDWCWRMWKSGWQVWYAPDICVIHHGGASSRQRSADTYALLLVSKVHFFRRCYGPLSALCLAMGLRAISFLKLILWMILSLLPVGHLRRRARLPMRRELVFLKHDLHLPTSNTAAVG